MKVNRNALIYSTSLAIILSQQAGTLRVFGANCASVVGGSAVGPTVSQFWANKSTYWWRTDDSCDSSTLDDRGCYSVSVGKPGTTEVWLAATGADTSSTWGSYQIKTYSTPHEC